MDVFKLGAIVRRASIQAYLSMKTSVAAYRFIGFGVASDKPEEETDTEGAKRNEGELQHVARQHANIG